MQPSLHRRRLEFPFPKLRGSRLIPSVLASLAGLVAMAALPACSGTIGGGPGTGDGEQAAGGDPSGGTPGASGGASNTKGGGSSGGGATAGAGSGPGDKGGLLGGLPVGSSTLRPMRRLSKTEYENTVRDLLGPTVSVGVSLPLEPPGEASYRLPSEITPVELDLFEQGANNAARAGSGAIPACAGTADPRMCASDFVKSFGQRAFRRPVLDAEVTQLLALYDKLKAAPVSLSHADAMKTLLAAILQSPQFLFHWELGPQKPTTQNGRIALNGWEMASRLSYLIWGTMPDQALFQAAQNGDLATPEGIDAQTRRLLKDKTRAAYFAQNLFGQWIALEKLDGLIKDKSVTSDFASLVDPLRNETTQFITKAVLEDGTWSALLTSRDSFVNGPLSTLYGVKGVTGDGFKAQTLPAERAGLFTRAAFLAIKALPSEGSPIHRGKVISTRLLCNRIEPPPPSLMVMVPAGEPGKTERERYAVHGQTPGCAACHSMMDPFGFAFGNFDAVGRYRTTDQGKPIDASGTIEDLDGKRATFKDAGEMMALLAQSARVQSCATAQLMLLALGRTLSETDRAPLAQITKAFQSSGDLRDLVVALAKSDSFRFRTPAEGEVTQ